VSDVLQQEVGEKFGVRQKTVLSLHRQKQPGQTGQPMKRKTSLKYSINKKEKNNVKFQSYRSHAASEHLLIHHIHIVSR